MAAHPRLPGRPLLRWTALAIAAALPLLPAAEWCRPSPGKCNGHRQELRTATDPFGNVTLEQWPDPVIQVVDWNQDGHPDLLVSDASGIISCYEGLPGGNVTLSANCSLGSLRFAARRTAPFFTAADWDQDGDYDLLIWAGARSEDEDAVLLFYESTDSNTLRFHSILLQRHIDDFLQLPPIAAADWDRDGRVDLFVGQEFFRRLPQGGLEEVPPERRPLTGLDLQGDAMYSLAAADWDGDGALDLILGKTCSLDCSIVTTLYFQRMADGSLSQRQGAANPFGASSPFGASREDCPLSRVLAVADWNGDGLLDLITSRDGRVNLCLSSLDLDFVERTGLSSPFNRMHRKLQSPAVTDWNADGRLDLLVGSKYGEVQYFERMADGSLAEHELIPSAFDDYAHPQHRDAVYWGFVPDPVDWDGDGDLDLLGVTMSWEGVGRPRYYERLDNGSLARREGAASPFHGLPLGASTVDVEAADWDGDGDVDLIVCELNVPSGDMRLRYFERVAGDRLLEREGALGDVRFGAVPGGRPSVLAIDRNGDGLLDLVVSDYDRMAYVYYERLPLGNFTLRDRGGILRVDSYTQRIAMADWNGDGYLEVVAGIGDREGGFMQYFDPGYCAIPESCSSRGWCNPTQGTCLCLRGHDLADCSACRPGYFSAGTRNVYSRAASEVRECRACPHVGMTAAGSRACSARGVCDDDRRARGGEGNVSVYAVPAHGSGRCLCNAPFSGEDCGVGECGAGEEYDAYGLRGLGTCRLCAPGYHKQAAGDTPCQPCPQDSFADGTGSAACRVCGSHWLRVRVNEQSTACDLAWDSLALAPLFLLLSAALFAVLSVLLSHKVKVRDVRLQPEGVVLTARGLHWLLRDSQVRFRGTGHPLLDLPGEKEAYRVRILNSTQLLLLGADGQPITSSIDTSQGEAHVGLVAVLFSIGRLGVPFSLWVCLLLGMLMGAAIIASILEGRSSVHITSLELVMTLVGLLVALALRLCRVRRDRASKLDFDLQTFAAVLRKANPNPRPCERGALRAISAQQLVDFFSYFADHIGSRNMYYVCANLLRPLTRPLQLSYAELAGPRRLQWFCSHFWGTPFAHFMDTVRKHAEGLIEGQELGLDALSYWICSFSNNQWKVAEELGQGVQGSSFYRALRSGCCKGTIMILDDKVQPLTRSWCLFELLQTAMLSKEQQEEGFAGLLLCTPSGVMNRGQSSVDMAMAISKKLSTLRLQDASATSLQDKQMIDDLVGQQPGGFEQVNKFLIQAVLGALQATHARFQEDLRDLRSSLSSIVGHPVLPEEGSAAAASRPGSDAHRQEGEQSAAQRLRV